MIVTTRLAVILALGVIFGLGTGCRSDHSRANKATEAKTSEGGTKDGKTNERSKEGQAIPSDNSSFRLGELNTVELKRGGVRTFEVSISRGAGFRSEVKFSLQPTMPREAKGITFTPADWMLNSNENSMAVTAKAAPDAAIGTFSWKLIVRPRVGNQETRALTVVVSQ